MRTKFFTLFLVVVLAALLVGPSVFANCGKCVPGHMEHGKGMVMAGHGKKMADHGKGKMGKKGLADTFFHKVKFFLKHGDALEISDEQVKKIKSLKLEAKKDQIQGKAEVEVLALDIRSKLHEDRLNTSEINKLIDKKYEVKKKMAKSIVKALGKLKEALSEEQMEKAKEFWKSKSHK